MGLMIFVLLLVMLFEDTHGFQYLPREKGKPWESNTQLDFDGTFVCPLQKPFCFTGFYKESRRWYDADDDLVHIPFRCVSGYSRHTAHYVYHETYETRRGDVILADYHWPYLELHHNCSRNGRTHHLRKDFIKVNARHDRYFEEYRLDILEQGHTIVNDESAFRMTRDRKNLKNWLRSRPYHWNSTLDGYQPTENFKFLVKGNHVLPHGELEYQKFAPKSKEEQLKKLDEEKKRLLEKIAIEEAENPGKQKEESDLSEKVEYYHADDKPTIEDVVAAWKKRKQAEQMKNDSLLEVAEEKKEEKETVGEEQSVIQLTEAPGQEEGSGEAGHILPKD